MAAIPPNQQLAQIRDEEDLLLAAGLLVIYDYEQREQRIARRRGRRAPRTVWVRPWLLRRTIFGHYENLLQELNIIDKES